MIDPKRKEELKNKYLAWFVSETKIRQRFPLEQDTADYWLSVLDTELENKIKEVREGVEQMKQFVSIAYGTNKYDSCYDDVLSLPSLKPKIDQPTEISS